MMQTTIEPQGLTIERYGYDDEDSLNPRHVDGETVILSMTGSGRGVDGLTLASLQAVNDKTFYLTLQRFYGGSQPVTIELNPSQTDQLMLLLGAHHESRQIVSLRSAHDALNAEAARLRQRVAQLEAQRDADYEARVWREDMQERERLDHERDLAVAGAEEYPF